MELKLSTLSNATVVVSNTNRSMEACVRLFCAYTLLREQVRRGLATGWSPVQGTLLTV
jgi:hypothetical protein